ncbi:MAG: acyl-CoA thioester hydrolase [Alteromonas macleodii]
MIPFLTPLDADALRRAGIAEPWSYGMADRVRFGEIDALNHVNNVEYLRWYETLRVNYLHDYGIYKHAGINPKFVVKNVELDYRSEVFRGANYINVARTTQMRKTSFTMEYVTFVDGQITTTGNAVIVLLNANNIKRVLPEALRRIFIKLDGAVQA